MAGEINGTTTVIQNGVGEIVGQMETTMTYNGAPIDISNKSNGDNITLLNNALAGKQIQFSGSIVYNNDVQFRAVRADALVGAQDTYTITYTGSGATTDESFTATMTPNGLSDAIPHGDKITSTITFLSSGAITHVPAV